MKNFFKAVVRAMKLIQCGNAYDAREGVRCF